ncbi:MAG: UDP-glucose/GDP-mannose dehydrogenase family protein [Proteobacteria bacterium]|nr:UDP-glucose/GDP-mannose dehydrogenase family protein [Pseudomonadota bacterium]
MKVSVFGSGYVGLVAGACFAESGNEVVCMDVDREKIEGLKNGVIPIYEPGLEEMIKRNVRQRRLSFTTDAKDAVQKSLYNFIAVGTPPGEDGSADLQYVLNVAETIGTHMDDFKIVVDKSTVPVGTADLVQKAIADVLRSRKMEIEFDVVSNPEFLKEGAAINDFMYPDRVVIGVDDPRTAALMKELYAPFMRREDRLLVMDVRSAEMTKYAANSILATKISFMNEIAKLCEKVGADIDQVRNGIGSDSRIGPSFLFPGIGYGGSCFPKDVQALVRTGEANGCRMELLQSVENVNCQQKSYLIEMIKKVCGNDLKDHVFGVWGLAFKPKTDDMREAPSRIILNELLEMGAKIVASDPAAIDEAKKIWGDAITFEEYYYDVLNDIDALLVLTEWNDYRRPDFDRMKSMMKRALVFDGRNIYNPRKMKSQGFHYYSVGRPFYEP